LSAGSGHRKPNEKHPAELHKLMDQPDFQRCWKRPFTVIDTKQIPDSAGYSVKGDHFYRDVDLVKAIAAGFWVSPVSGRRYDLTLPGCPPHVILDALLAHERIEKCLLDADNPINLYLDAHEFASAGEDQFISQFIAPRLYNNALKPLIVYNQVKRLTDVPLDLSCAPLLDDPDAADKRITRRLIALGVVDAAKFSKKSVNYSLGKNSERCFVCANKIAMSAPWNAACKGVDGTILPEYWCKRFEPVETSNAKAQQGPPRFQSGGSEDRQGAGGQEPRSGAGRGVAQRERESQALEPAA
jgi:hypothetical protein